MDGRLDEWLEWLFGWITIARCLDRSTGARFILGSCEDEKKGSVRTSNSLSPLSSSLSLWLLSFLGSCPSLIMVMSRFFLRSHRPANDLLSSDRRSCIFVVGVIDVNAITTHSRVSLVVVIVRIISNARTRARYIRTVEPEFCTTFMMDLLYKVCWNGRGNVEVNLILLAIKELFHENVVMYTFASPELDKLMSFFLNLFN